MNEKDEQEAIFLLIILANYTDDRQQHPQCIFCLADMQDNLSNSDDGSPSDGGDPEHAPFCPVVRARYLLDKIGQMKLLSPPLHKRQAIDEYHMV